MNSSHLDTVNERLRGCGILPTAQRVRIASVLLAAPQHLTADQILAELRNRGEKVSKATVYNTLNLLAGKGVIRQLAVDGDRAWFDSNTAPHFHFQDVDTGALTDLPPRNRAFRAAAAAPGGHGIRGH